MALCNCDPSWSYEPQPTELGRSSNREAVCCKRIVHSHCMLYAMVGILLRRLTFLSILDRSYHLTAHFGCFCKSRSEELCLSVKDDRLACSRNAF